MDDTPRKPDKVPLPKRLTVEEVAASPGQDSAPYRTAAIRSHLRIARRWFSWEYVVLGVFCAAWDGFLGFWYWHAFGAGGTQWMTVVFPIVHVVVGIGLTYTVVAGFLNRTVITVDSERLAVRHRPLPWPGNRDLPSRDIEQLHCERRVTESDDGQTVRYELTASLRDGRRGRLLKGLRAADQARYIEHEVERWLDIVDRPMNGEYRG